MNTKERRLRIIELQKELGELKEVQIIEDIQESLKDMFEDDDIAELIKKFNLPIPQSISVEYGSESDDEGGSNLRPNYFSFYSSEVDDIQSLYEEASWTEKYTSTEWRTGKLVENSYETNVYDQLRDWLHDLFSDGDEILEYVGDGYNFKVGN